MRRRGLAAVLAVATLLQSLLAGCSESEPSKELTESSDTTEYDYQIYCVNEDGTALESWGYNMSSDDMDLDKVVEELVTAFEAEPTEDGYASARPEKIKSITYTVDENVVRVNCDKYYDKLDSLAQLFFKSALILTMTQVEGIEYVYFSVKGQPLTDSAGNPVGYLGRNSILTHEEFSGATTSVAYTTIYYPNEAGDALIAENVYYLYDEQQSPAMYILEMLQGNMDTGVEKSGDAVIPEKAVVKNVCIKDGICYVDFDESYINSKFTGVNSEVLLYALVNSLCEIFEVTGVQITINGRADVMYKNEISLNQIFRMNLNLVE